MRRGEEVLEHAESDVMAQLVRTTLLLLSMMVEEQQEQTTSGKISFAYQDGSNRLFTMTAEDSA